MISQTGYLARWRLGLVPRMRFEVRDAHAFGSALEERSVARVWMDDRCQHDAPTVKEERQWHSFTASPCFSPSTIARLDTARAPVRDVRESLSRSRPSLAVPSCE